jgi:2-amino-4-hydroxy-6-hydroxymethyldihydropteridine diphosphokinase
MAGLDLHPIVTAAARGRLPGWAAVGPQRLAHMSRVAAMLDRWAAELELSDRDRARWVSAGWLHDALRDGDDDLLARLAPEWPQWVRHGPAAAALLEADGVSDEELLEAVRYLEPGRPFLPIERASLSARLPRDAAGVLLRVIELRLRALLDNGQALHSDTVSFWNDLVGGR